MGSHLGCGHGARLRLSHRVARALFAAQGIKFRIRGAENVPRTGGAVFAINHTGYMDFTYAGLAAHPAKRLVRFMAKESIWKNPVAGR